MTYQMRAITEFPSNPDCICFLVVWTTCRALTEAWTVDQLQPPTLFRERLLRSEVARSTSARCTSDRPLYAPMNEENRRSCHSPFGNVYGKRVRVGRTDNRRTLCG